MAGQTYYRAWTNAQWSAATETEKTLIAKALLEENGLAQPSDEAASNLISAMNEKMQSDVSLTIEQVVDFFNTPTNNALPTATLSTESLTGALSAA